MRLVFAALFAELSCFGAITVTVVGTTNTQAVLTYAAPDSNPCLVQVSESSGLAPLVHDVDPILFNGSNSDARGASVNNGNQRVFIVGKRLTEQGGDLNWYSRALQTNTTHYFLVTCGSQTGSGTFPTKNVPLGNTNFEVPQGDSTGLGVVPTFPQDRTTVVIDPKTGVLAKRLWTAADGYNPNLGSQARGNPCSSVLSGPGPGYFCSFGGQEYYIIPDTGEIRFLGGYCVPGDANFPYGGGCAQIGTGVATGTAATQFLTVSSRSGAETYILKITYAGDYITSASNTWTVTYLTPPGSDLYSRIHDYDSSFTNTTMGALSPGAVGGCGLVGSNGDYNFIGCGRGYQNSWAQYYAMDMASGLIVSKFGGTKSQPTRWCGNHTLYQIPGSPIAFIAAHSLAGGYGTNTAGSVGSGPYETNLSADISATDTTIHVTSEPLSITDFKYENYLMDAAIGDDFSLTDAAPYPTCAHQNGAGGCAVERVKITGKSRTIWTVQRDNEDPGHGSIGPAIAWPAGTVVEADCQDWRNMWWFFLVDHNPTAISAGLVVEVENSSHTDIEPWGKVEAFASGKFSTPANYIAQPFAYQYVDPTFAGVYSGASGDSASDYSSIQVPSATWLLNERNFYGNQGYGGSILVAGETQLYDYGHYYYSEAGPPLAIKQKATLVMSAGHQLVDISGPGAHLTGTGGDAYQSCTPNIAGECRTSGDPGGAGVVGHVYANVPNLSHSWCDISTGPTSSLSSLCVLNVLPQGGLIQLGTSPNGVGLPAGFTSPTYLGFGQGRMLTSGFSGIRDTGGLAKPLVDGSWTFVDDGQSRSAASYNVSSASWSAGVSTLTVGTHAGVHSQNRVVVSGVNPAGYNGTFNIAAETPTTISYRLGGDPGAYASGGLADVPLGLLAIKMPPFPSAATVDRSTFVRAPLTLTPPGSMGIASAAVQFGYTEQGTPSQHYCTSRRESCVAVAATVTDSNPFQFETTDTYSRAACSTSCTITIPLLPIHVAYYQVKYYDGGGAFVSNGPAGIVGDFTGYGSAPK